MFYTHKSLGGETSKEMNEPTVTWFIKPDWLQLVKKKTKNPNTKKSNMIQLVCWLSCVITVWCFCQLSLPNLLIMTRQRRIRKRAHGWPKHCSGNSVPRWTGYRPGIYVTRTTQVLCVGHGLSVHEQRCAFCFLRMFAGWSRQRIKLSFPVVRAWLICCLSLSFKAGVPGDW